LSATTKSPSPPAPLPKGERRQETPPPLSQRERGDKRLPRPSPKGREETRDSLALWERAGVRGTNLEILKLGKTLIH